MKKLILGAVLALGIIAVPASTLAAGLTSSQIQSILTLLSAFGADQSVINSVQIALNGGTPTTASSQFCHNFNNDITIGSTGEDVSALYSALDLDAITAPDQNHSQKFNEDTAASVVELQAKYGIRQTGYVGPITRKKLNSLYGCGDNQQPTPVVSTTQPATPAPTAAPQPSTPSTSTTPAITVLSPNGGESWYSGKTEPVEWKTEGVPANNIVTIRLRLVDKNYDWSMMVTNSGSANFKVPVNSLAGPYVIEITTKVNNQTYTDASDSYFKVVDSTTSTTVTPTVSEQVKCVFSNATSEQKCYGYAPAPTVGSDPIYYSCTGVGTCVVDVKGLKSTQITWGSSCGGSADTSIDGNSEYANFSCSASTPPSIIVLNPNGGEYWDKNNSMVVEWKTVGIPQDNKMLIRLRSVNTNQEYNLATVSNDGSEKVTVPADIPLGAYTLEIKTTVNGQSYTDSSDSYFKVVDSSVTSTTQPVVKSVIISNSVLADAVTQYTITVTAADSSDGNAIIDEYALINYQGTNAGAYRGFPMWSLTQDRSLDSYIAAPIACSGGGVGAFYKGSPETYGAGYINLLSCKTSVAGNIRTASFVVTFNKNFTSPVTNNTLSGYAVNSNGANSGWSTFNTFDLSQTGY